MAPRETCSLRVSGSIMSRTACRRRPSSRAAETIFGDRRRRTTRRQPADASTAFLRSARETGDDAIIRKLYVTPAAPNHRILFHVYPHAGRGRVEPCAILDVTSAAWLLFLYVDLAMSSCRCFSRRSPTGGCISTCSRATTRLSRIRQLIRSGRAARIRSVSAATRWGRSGRSSEAERPDSRGAIAARAARALATGQADLWFLPKVLHLLDVEAAGQRVVGQTADDELEVIRCRRRLRRATTKARSRRRRNDVEHERKGGNEQRALFRGRGLCVPRGDGPETQTLEVTSVSALTDRGQRRAVAMRCSWQLALASVTPWLTRGRDCSVTRREDGHSVSFVVFLVVASGGATLHDTRASSAALVAATNGGNVVLNVKANGVGPRRSIDARRSFASPIVGTWPAGIHQSAIIAPSNFSNQSRRCFRTSAWALRKRTRAAGRSSPRPTG